MLVGAAEPSTRPDCEGDLRLVEAAQRGDRDAFSRLYQRHARLVRAVLLARLDYQDVPDQIQEVFLTAWTQLEALRAIATLPDAYRETLLLRYVEGMTGPEIAARTGLTEGAVRLNQHRGMRLLRERLQVPARSGASS